VKENLYKITGNSRIACCRPTRLIDCIIHTLLSFDQ